MRKRIWSDWLGIKGHIEDTRKGKMIEISRQNSYLDKKLCVQKENDKSKGQNPAILVMQKEHYNTNRILMLLNANKSGVVIMHFFQARCRILCNIFKT